MSERLRLTTCFLASCLIVYLAYSAGLSGSFIFDDGSSITSNSTLRLFNGSLSSLITASTGGTASPLGRPLSMASFAVNLYFGGDNPYYYKLANLLLHLANGLLVLMLVRQLWPLLTGEKKSSLAAIWISTVWLLHPINLTPVLLVVQRMTGLAAFFTLSALCLYIYGRQKDGIKAYSALAAGLLLCWPAAVLSKETGLLLPFFILLCEWLALRSIHQIPYRVRQFGILVLLVAAAAIITIMVQQWDHIVISGYRYRDFGLVERLLTESRVLWFYLLQLILPWPDLFSLYHDDIVVSRGLTSPPETLFAVIGWLLLITYAIFRHKQAPLFVFSVIWFLSAHALESTILPLEITYEHRNYLASIGLLIWSAKLLLSSPPHQPGKVPKLVLAICFTLFCGLVTTLRAAQWGDEYLRTQIDAATHPNSARANYEAATAIIRRTFDAGGGNSLAYKTAQFHLKRATQLDPDNKAALIGQLYLDCVIGYPKNDNLLITLRDRFAKARLSPGDQTVIQSLSSLLVEKRLCLDDAEVKSLLEAALSNPAADGPIRGMLNVVAMDYAAAKIGSLPLALTYAKAAADSNPSSVPLRINVIHLLLALGDKEAARREFAILASLHIAPRDKADVEQLNQKLRSMELNANAH